MSAASSTLVTRRAVLQTAPWGGLGVAGTILAARPSLAAADAQAEDDELVRRNEVIKRLTGGVAVESSRVHLEMPPVFGNGYSVPLTLAVDSPMTEADHVRLVHIVAPRNPIIVVADFHFGPRSGRVALSTRIRLSEPQEVLAIAEMSDGAILMARTRVKVETNGCA